MTARPRKATRRRIPEDRGPGIPLVYSAVVFPTGEIPEIQETIGRRRMRAIDPRSREGRELLASGRVRFWRGPGWTSARVAMRDLYRDLAKEARAEHARHAPQQAWDPSCRSRLETLKHWESIYSGKSTRDH